MTMFAIKPARCVAVGAAVSALTVVLMGCGGRSLAAQANTGSRASVAIQQPNAAHGAVPIARLTAAANNAYVSADNAILDARNAQDHRIGQLRGESGSNATDLQAMNIASSQVATLLPTMQAIHFPSPFHADRQNVSGYAATHANAPASVALTIALNTHNTTNHHSEDIAVHTTLNALVASTQALLVTLW